MNKLFIIINNSSASVNSIESRNRIENVIFVLMLRLNNPKQLCGTLACVQKDLDRN
jgi:hypothetical protein